MSEPLKKILADTLGIAESEIRDDPFGFVLVDDDEVVGYIGTICSRRVIGGRQEKFCNVTSWVTDKNHRQQAIMLLTPMLKLAGYTITNQAPAKHVHPLFTKL